MNGEGLNFVADIRLDGKVAIVTGGARGLGRTMALGLARAGAEVVLADVDASALSDTSASQDFAGLRHRIVTCDITSRADCEAAVQMAISAFGRLDVLVNNAGRGPNHVTTSPLTASLKFWQADPQRWEDVIRTNVVGTFNMARVAAPIMIGQGSGRIVNVTTSLTTMRRKANTPYGVSKAAIETETLIWSQDLEGTGVTINSLLPGGAADTDFVSPHTRAAAHAGGPQLLNPGVMVAPLLWLASDLSAGTTGCRFVGAKWDNKLPPSQAAAMAREPQVIREAS